MSPELGVGKALRMKSPIFEIKNLIEASMVKTLERLPFIFKC